LAEGWLVYTVENIWSPLDEKGTPVIVGVLICIRANPVELFLHPARNKCDGIKLFRELAGMRLRPLQDLLLVAKNRCTTRLSTVANVRWFVV